MTMGMNAGIPDPSARYEALFARIDELRDAALALEREAVARRQPDLRTAGRYQQMLEESEADDLERRALRLRRQAAELESEIR